MGTEPEQEKPGRQAQFEALVAVCETPLLRYVSRILNSSDSSQDVVQDTLIRCYRSWDGDLVHSPPLMNWLYRVAHNRAIDIVRKTNRRATVHETHTKEVREEEESRQCPKPGVSEAAERASEALQTLSLREQQVVILKIYEDRSYREISELLGISVSNVGYILHHAMRKLAETLREAPTP